MFKYNNFSIVLPCFNESKNIKKLLPKINRLFKNKKYKTEIIVVNDGSVDETESVLLDLKKKIFRLKIINLKKNFGKAISLKEGILFATGKIILTMDTDLQYDPTDFLKMINKINKGYDFVNGRRKKRKDKFLVKIFSLVHNYLLRIFFNQNVYDFFSGIKVFKKEILNEKKINILPRYLIFLALKQNYKVTEIEISHFNREFGRSTYNLIDRLKLAFGDLFVIIFVIFFSLKNKKNKNNIKRIRSIIQ